MERFMTWNHLGVICGVGRPNYHSLQFYDFVDSQKYQPLLRQKQHSFFLVGSVWNGSRLGISAPAVERTEIVGADGALYM